MFRKTLAITVAAAAFAVIPATGAQATVNNGGFAKAQAAKAKPYNACQAMLDSYRADTNAATKAWNNGDVAESEIFDDAARNTADQAARRGCSWAL